MDWIYINYVKPINQWQRKPKLLEKAERLHSEKEKVGKLLRAEVPRTKRSLNIEVKENNENPPHGR